ncbi:MAG: molybdenum cofactor guanylyltransferase [Phycisphaeraceae bacterium]|nr:molybdenum cofactor guanylyltransferase [Phycisphaeraceae bacterium]
MNLRQIPAYILAGGRSSRFGSDKARALFQGQPLIARQATLLLSQVDRVIVVARLAGQYQDLGLTTVADLQPDQGPVGGLRTALRHRGQERGEGWMVLTCCDLVILRPAWLTALCDGAQDRPGLDAIVFRDQRWQPFPGLYHTRLLERADVRCCSSLQHALGAAHVHPLAIPSDWPASPQANTREALGRMESDAELQRGV